MLLIFSLVYQYDVGTELSHVDDTFLKVSLALSKDDIVATKEVTVNEYDPSGVQNGLDPFEDSLMWFAIVAICDVVIRHLDWLLGLGFWSSIWERSRGGSGRIQSSDMVRPANKKNKKKNSMIPIKTGDRKNTTQGSLDILED